MELNSSSSSEATDRRWAIARIRAMNRVSNWEPVGDRPQSASSTLRIDCANCCQLLFSASNRRRPAVVMVYTRARRLFSEGFISERTSPFNSSRWRAGYSDPDWRESLFRDLTEAVRDAPAVVRAKGEDLQDQEVQRSLQQVGFGHVPLGGREDSVPPSPEVNGCEPKRRNCRPGGRATTLRARETRSYRAFGWYVLLKLFRWFATVYVPSGWTVTLT